MLKHYFFITVKTKQHGTYNWTADEKFGDERSGHKDFNSLADALADFDMAVEATKDWAAGTSVLLEELTADSEDSDNFSVKIIKSAKN